MNSHEAERLMMTRRQLLGRGSTGIGVAALASLLNPELSAIPALDPMGRPINPETGGLAELPHFEPKAKRVIFLHQSGAPSQIDLFDYKPKLKDFHGSELPDSVRRGQRITGMTSGQDSFPVASSVFKFQRHGQTGTGVDGVYVDLNLETIYVFQCKLGKNPKRSLGDTQLKEFAGSLGQFSSPCAGSARTRERTLRVSVDAALRAGIFKASGSFDPMGWSVGARRSFPRP